MLLRENKKSLVRPSYLVGRLVAMVVAKILDQHKGREKEKQRRHVE